jgi:hypothetical protein
MKFIFYHDDTTGTTICSHRVIKVFVHLILIVSYGK